MTPSAIKSSDDALQLIDRARDAEMCRDLDSLTGLLSQVWDDIDRAPDYSRFGAEINAELLRLSGTYLSQYGKSKGLVDHQERANEMLARSVRIFELIGNREKVAEAEIARAACYWYSGEVEKCESILSSLERGFKRDQPTYLQIQVNRIGCLNWQGKHDKALTIVDSIHTYALSCPVQKLQVQFHNQAGITYQLANDNRKAIDHLLKAISLSRLSNNIRNLGLNLNCLSMTFRRAGDYVSAHNYVKEALTVLKSVGDDGWIPNVLDTQALIFLDEGRTDEAVETIDRALSLFSESEDYSGLTDAMFTKCRCLLRLGRRQEAFAIFSNLGNMARARTGETALLKYSAQLANEVRFIAGKTLRERTGSLKKDLIREALRDSKGKIGEAAKTLGESQQSLSFMLKSKYPDLYDEFGIRRKPRKTKSGAAKPKKPEAQIQHILMPENMKYAYDFHVDDDLEISTYMLSPELSQKLGLRSCKLIAVSKVFDLEPDMMLLYKTEDKYFIDQVTYDKMTDLFVIERGDGDFVFLTEEVTVLGIPIGYCELDEINTDLLRFRKISPFGEK